MKIAVSENDIAEGDCTVCPIERAFMALGLPVSVGPDFVCFFAGGYCLITLPLPPGACDFIAAFDDHRPVAPFDFEMQIPAEAIAIP